MAKTHHQAKRVTQNRQFGEASDKQIAGALGFTRELDRLETTQRLLPQDTQLHLGQAVSPYIDECPHQRTGDS